MKVFSLKAKKKKYFSCQNKNEETISKYSSKLLFQFVEKESLKKKFVMIHSFLSFFFCNLKNNVNVSFSYVRFFKKKIHKCLHAHTHTLRIALFFIHCSFRILKTLFFIRTKPICTMKISLFFVFNLNYNPLPSDGVLSHLLFITIYSLIL